MSHQSNLDTFREMNRYDERNEDWPSEVVFEHPRRTLDNGWKKYHATRDCGGRVSYLEDSNRARMSGSDRYEYRLYCHSCGHRVEETEVLFIGGEWFSKNGWKVYEDTIDNLWIPKSRIVDLGPDPDREEVRRALELTRIEGRAGGITGFAFGNSSWYECGDCGHEAPIMFDDKCRMCYEGEWTSRMQSAVDSLGISVRERNNSFVHRLPKKVDPLAPGDTAGKNTVLWRRHDEELVSKIVVVEQRLQDKDDGHIEYILTDPTKTEQWRYRKEDLQDCFWDTGLYANNPGKPIEDDRIREVWERVKDR